MFTHRCLCVSIAFMIAGIFSPAISMGDQPNILFIMTDQQAYTGMSCTGNPYLDTPAFDALAAEGMRFDRAYVTQPLCLPLRSNIQTGRYSHEIGTINNGRPIQGEFPMLGVLIRDAGYENAYIGKWHVGTSFEKAGYDNASNVGLDDKKADAACEFLLREHEKPFFLTVSFMNPHNVCELARGQNLPDGPIGDPPTDLSLLPPLPDNFSIPANEPTVIREIQNSSAVHYPTLDWDELKWRQYLWGYYRLCEKVDAELGRVLDALEECGQADNTAIVFCSDHGEGIAMHHWNQKQILYDQATRVPMIIVPPHDRDGTVSNDLISVGIDVPVTILDLAGVTQPDSMPGVSLLPLVLGETDSIDRDYVIAETMFARGGTNLGATGRMIRTDRFKYCVYDNGERREQLFDMNADPGEMNNLAGAEAFQNELIRHRKLLLDWAEETSDADFPFVQP
jgi:arylsulfatase A-like enzyme